MAKDQDGGEDEEGSHRVYSSTLNETRSESDERRNCSHERGQVVRQDFTPERS